jgi:hypothetical protein
VAFLTKHNASRDYLVKNSRASEYLRDAATDQTDGHGSQHDLYGDVIVLGYDKAVFDNLIDIPSHVDAEDFEPFGLGHPGASARWMKRWAEIGVTSTALDDGFEPGDSVRTPEYEAGLDWPSAPTLNDPPAQERGIDPPGIRGFGIS